MIAWTVAALLAVAVAKLAEVASRQRAALAELRRRVDTQEGVLGDGVQRMFDRYKDRIDDLEHTKSELLGRLEAANVALGHARANHEREVTFLTIRASGLQAELALRDVRHHPC